MRLNLDVEPKLKIRARRKRVFPRLAVVLLGVLAAICSVPELPAQPAAVPGPGALSSNRFLFVADTSAAMKRFQPDIIKVVWEIIDSSASGQLRQGDTLGLWTFNTEVSSDLPLQIWNVHEQGIISEHVTDFLKHQIFSGTSRLDSVLSVLLPLIHHSDIITVIIISDGKGKMKGTPFDQEINDLYKQDLKDTKNHPVPIVTVLQGRGGKVAQYTVNALPWPVDIPALPKPQPHAPPVAQEKPKPAPMAQPVEKPVALPPPVIVKTAPPVVVPAPIAPLAEPVPQPPVAPPEPPAVSQVAPPPPVTKTEPPAIPPPPSTVPPPPPFTLATTPAAAPVKTEPPPAPVESNSPQLIITLKPNMAQAPVTSAEAAPAPVAPVSPAVTPARISPPDRPVTMATTPVSDRPKTLLIVGIVLAVVGLILVVITVIRGRDNGPSLITRSMNDKNRG